MESLLTDRLATLSHPGRMSVFRLLMRRCPDDVPAGEISTALSLKPSTASVYLAALTKTGLIAQRRDGTRLLYTVNLEAARAVVAGLFFDCCGGRADLCPPQFVGQNPGILPTDPQKQNVLFVCTGNSARSVFAETILRDMAGDRFTAFSAGTSPRSELNPMAIDVLQAQGHELSRLRAKHIAEFQAPDAPRMDFVFTVCDQAANEDGPVVPGHPVSGHWGQPDPVAASGTEDDKHMAFREAYAALQSRIAAFVSLPAGQMAPGSLQAFVDDIGRKASHRMEKL